MDPSSEDSYAHLSPLPPYIPDPPANTTAVESTETVNAEGSIAEPSSDSYAHLSPLPLYVSDLPENTAVEAGETAATEDPDGEDGGHIDWSDTASEYEATMGDELIRLTAASWVHHPDYDAHPRAFELLLMRVISSLQDGDETMSDIDSKEQDVRDFFASAYQQRLEEEEEEMGSASELCVEESTEPSSQNEDNLEAAASSPPPMRLKGKVQFADPATPEPESPAREVPAVHKQLQRVPLDSVKRKQEDNIAASKNVMKSWIEGTAGASGSKGSHIIVPGSSAHREPAGTSDDSDLEIVAPTDIDQTLFKKKSTAQSKKRRLSTSNEAENPQRKRRNSEDSMATEGVAESAPITPTEDRAPTAVNESVDVANDIQDEETDHEVAPDVMDTLALILSATRRNGDYTKTLVKQMVHFYECFQQNLPEFTKALTTTATNTEDVHMSVNILSSNLELYMSSILKESVRRDMEEEQTRSANS